MTWRIDLSYMLNNLKCIFCRIDQGKVLFKNNIGLIIKDKYPDALIHLLVIPKKHIVDLKSMLGNKENAYLLSSLIRLGSDYLNSFKINDFTVKINYGSISQHVPHLHIHFLCWNVLEVPKELKHKT